MKVALPLGDVVDKVTILLLKEQRIDDKDKVRNVKNELAVLRQSWMEEGLPTMSELTDWPGREVNGQLWDVEDELRHHEARQDFGATFVGWLVRSTI